MPRRILPALILLTLACGAAPATETGDATESAGSTDSATAPAAVEWIEVPLTEHTFAEFGSSYRQDTIMIPVPSGERGLEYKLAVDEGDAIVYSWEVLGFDDASLVSEFHGHPPREEGKPGTVMFYRRATGTSEKGMLIAPFSGIHGWWFQHDEDIPILVRLAVAGFYRRLD